MSWKLLLFGADAAGRTRSSEHVRLNADVCELGYLECSESSAANALNVNLPLALALYRKSSPALKSVNANIFQITDPPTVKCIRQKSQ